MRAHEMQAVFANIRATAHEGRYDLMSTNANQLVTVRWGEGDERRFSLLLPVGTISSNPGDWDLEAIRRAVEEWRSSVWISSQGPTVDAWLAWLELGDEHRGDGMYVMPNDDLMSYALDHHRFRYLSARARRLSEEAGRLRAGLVGLQQFLSDDVVLAEDGLQATT